MSEAFLAAFSAEAMARYIAGANYIYLVAILENGIAGVIGIRDRRHLYHLFVAESWQGRGIGGALWNRLRTILLAESEEVTMTVNSSLKAAPIHEHFGFLAAGPRVDKGGICYLPMQAVIRRSGLTA